MIQIKTFKSEATDKEINNFLKKHRNISIINSNPFTIQYEIEDDIEKAIMEIKGLPLDICLHCGYENWIRCGLIIVFQSHIVFKLAGKKYIKININTFETKDEKNKKVGTKAVKFLTFQGQVDYGVGLDFYNWNQTLMQNLEYYGMYANDSNYLYNQRTHVIEKSAKIRAIATVKSAGIVSHSINNLAKATLISGLAQAKSNGMSEKEKLFWSHGDGANVG